MNVYDESGYIDFEQQEQEEKSRLNNTKKYDASPASSRTPQREQITHKSRSIPDKERLAARLFSPANLGLVTLFLPSLTSQHKRQDDVAHTVRLNMGRVYLKFVIQALLYLLSTYIFISAVTLFFKLPCMILIPIAILCALQLAARSMMYGINRLHAANADQNYSLTNDIIWASNKFQGLIEHASNFALRLFTFIPERLAQTTLLDRQMAHIPDYSRRTKPVPGII